MLSKLYLLLGSEKGKLKAGIIINQMEEEGLEADYDKIIQVKIVKEHLIKDLNKKMLNEARLLEETEEKLFGMTYRITKSANWGKQKELIILKRRLDTQRLESGNKINELIKKISKIEVMITEEIYELNRIEKGLKKTRVRIVFYKKLIG